MMQSSQARAQSLVFLPAQKGGKGEGSDRN